MAFLHGSETVEVQSGAKPIQLVRTSIIGLVGIAPKGTPNSLKVVTTPRQAVEEFGEQVPGFTIPQALASIFDQGNGAVMVVNVFDSATHVTAVTDESLTITNGKATLSAPPVGGVITLTNQAGDTTYTPGTHYKVDVYGKITVLDFATIAEGATVLADFSKLDASAITASVVIGTQGPPRTGFKLFDEAFSQFGYWPKILICPKYCEVAGVAAEMISRSASLRAVTIIDAPSGTTYANAIAGRGPSGTLAGFQSSSDRVLLTYPYVKAFDPATNADQNRPLSPFLAGAMAKSDNTRGYWFSPSNVELNGLTGVEIQLTSAINSQTAETNLLNAAGIMTVFKVYGTGFRTWGNRSAAYPTNTSPENFVSIRRIKDILHESLELAMLPFLDKPINQALIDSIRESVNAFINTLIGRGALTVGSICTFNIDNNPPAQIAAGQLVFDITMMGPTPAERITFNSLLDINLLRALA